MSRRERIRFTAAPRDIRLRAGGGVLPEDWREQLRAAEAAGYQRGLVDGETKLSEQLLQQRAELMELQNGAIRALREAVPQVVQQSEEAMVTLAFEIAQKLVAELPFTRELVAAAVREAVSQIEDTTEFNVLLHADDLALLQPNPAEALGGETAGRKMHFTASREVSRGGCVAQTRFGIIDTRRETKLARVEEALR